MSRSRSRLFVGAVVLGLVGFLAPAAVAAPAPNPSPTGPVGGGRMGEPGVIIVDLSGGAAAPPENDAQSWVVADVTTGEVLAARNPHERLKPASTLKTLTLLALMPTLDRNAVYTALFDDANQEGSKVGLVPDATYTVENLFYGMMLPSGNDAAHALANAVGGMPAATALLNAEANRLGAFDTAAFNTSGLDAEGQVSSAYDLALIQAAGLKSDLWRQIYGTAEYDFPAGPVPEGTPRPTYKTATKNALILNGYPGAVGGKTGYTDASGKTFVAAVERDGHLLVATFMRFGGATETLATQMFDWAFANRAALKPVGTLVTPDDVAPDPPSPEPTEGSEGGGDAGEGGSAGGSDGQQAGSTSGEQGAGQVDEQVDGQAVAAESSDSAPNWLILAVSGVLLAFAMVIIGRIARSDSRRRRKPPPRVRSRV